MRVVGFLCKFCVFMVLVFSTVSCSKEGADSDSSTEDDSSKTSMSDVINISLGVLGGVVDEQAGEAPGGVSSYLLNTKYFARIINDFFIPNAWASVCAQRANAQLCYAGKRSITYAECKIEETELNLNGSILMTYSDTENCDLGNEGDSVLRTFIELTRTASDGGIVGISSDKHTDYRYTEIGGGAKLTKNTSGWSLDVLGERRFHGNKVFDVSLRTTESVLIQRGLLRSEREITSGALELINNKWGYTATLRPKNLTYSGTCCTPTAGSISLSFEGSVAGSAEITFNTCGEATYIKDGRKEKIKITGASCI